MSPRLPGLAVVVACIVAANPAPAAVVVLSNDTTKDVAFTLTHPGLAAQPHKVSAGQVKSFSCGSRVDIRFDTGAKPAALQLDPYEVYVFAEKDGVTGLHAVEQAGKPLPVDDIKPYVEESQPVTIGVKLFVDDADRRVKRAWETAVRRRFAAAGEFLADQVPVRFEVIGTDEWVSDPTGVDTAQLRNGFRAAVKLEPKQLAVGVTSRLLNVKYEPGTEPPLGDAKLLDPFVLVRESDPRSEPERVEVLASQLAVYLGAITCSDSSSIMRPKLGDGKASRTGFRVQLDPMNVLAVSLWLEGLRAGATKPADLPAVTQGRLGRVYATLAKARPGEPIPNEITPLIVLAGGVVPAPAVVAPKSPDAVVVAKTPAASARIDAARKVVAAVVIAAETNAAGPRLRGDELTVLYIKTAAGVANFEPTADRAAAFLIGLGVALDDSETLRSNPLTASMCKKIESDDERKRRLASLGIPTVRNRRDLCQHFVVSAALAEIVGPALAEQAGLAKEMSDMTRPSGFSFTDLCADLSGVEFAKLVKAKPTILDEFPRSFGFDDFVPAMTGLRDGISAERFKKDYGAVGDERFQAAFDVVRKRVAATKAYAPAGK